LTARASIEIREFNPGPGYQSANPPAVAAKLVLREERKKNREKEEGKKEKEREREKEECRYSQSSQFWLLISGIVREQLSDWAFRLFAKRESLSPVFFYYPNRIPL